jgi:CO dehydrogenase/acetyl-CoA synthase delta subunit
MWIIRRCSGDISVDNLTKSIKNKCKEVMCKDVDWVKPAHNRFQLRHLTMVMKHLVS